MLNAFCAKIIEELNRVFGEEEDKTTEEVNSDHPPQSPPEMKEVPSSKENGDLKEDAHDFNKDCLSPEEYAQYLNILREAGQQEKPDLADAPEASISDKGKEEMY